MHQLHQRPLSNKAALSTRPYSANNPFTKTSRLNSCTIKAPPFCPIYNDIGTSMSPLKFEEFEATTVPIQTLTFKIVPSHPQQRRRRVMIMKTIQKDQPIRAKNSYRSLLKIFDISQSQEARRSLNSRKTVRTSTGKSQIAAHKRVCSELDLGLQTGSRLFDIGEVLSIAQGELNLRQLKVKRN